MKLDESLFEAFDEEETAELEDKEAENLSEIENRVANLQPGDEEIVIKMKTPIMGLTDDGFNTLHIIKRTPDWYRIWNEDEDGSQANIVNFSSFDNTLYWATLASQGDIGAVDETEVEEEEKVVVDEDLEIAVDGEEAEQVGDLEVLPEPTDDQINFAYRNQFIELINGEWDTIQDYNDLINNLREIEEYKEFIPVIEGIIKDEHNHIGNLQNVLDKLNPQSNKDLEDGDKEAQEILDGDKIDG